VKDHTNLVISVSFTHTLPREEIFTTGREAICLPLGLSGGASAGSQSRLLDLDFSKASLLSACYVSLMNPSFPFTVKHTGTGLLVK